MKRGDFIEDKFGQIQRDTLVAFNKGDLEIHPLNSVLMTWMPE
jgi:hypothetical protein